ncbi:MAG: hypothetical protein AB8H03_06210 [Saprospiraceae bacterium]
MQKDTSKNGEKVFKDKLANFTPPPSNNNNWQKIASQLDGEELDAFAKNNLSEIEPTPNPKIWANIKRELPLSLLVRNQLNWLSRIAAVLIIFMVAILFFDKKENISIETKNSEIASTNTIDEKIIPEENSDFVFAIGNDEKKETSASEELYLEDDKTLEDFWSSIDDDEDFISAVDQDIIEKSLQPLLKLPIENLEAALPNKNKISKKPISIFQQDPITLPGGDALSDEK